ncbi:hypothetical protein D3C78_1465120 [compost metagenome]
MFGFSQKTLLGGQPLCVIMLGLPRHNLDRYIPMYATLTQEDLSEVAVAQLPDDFQFRYDAVHGRFLWATTSMAASRLPLRSFAPSSCCSQKASSLTTSSTFRL